MKNYIVDNVRNYKKTRGWICEHFFPEGFLQKNSELEVKFTDEYKKVGESEKEHEHLCGKEVVIVIEGEMELLINGKIIIMKKGDFIYSDGRLKEAVLNTSKPSKLITIRTPSIPNNKRYL